MTTRRTMLVGLGAAALVAPVGITAATVAGAAADQISENSGLLDRYAAAINAHDTSVFTTLFTPAYIQHSGRSPSGLAAVQATFERLFAALPDVTLKIEDRILSADKVVARCTYSGTHRGTFRGVPPTGKPISFGTIDIWRVVDGKFAEHWDQIDSASLQKQLGSQ